MKRGRVLGALAAAGALAIAGALAVVVLASPFGGDAGEGDAATVRESQDNAGDPSGVGEGIEVHGDWVIEVRNPDGSVAEQREFTNALTQAGRRFLVHVLARQYFVDSWAIWAYDGGGQSPCLNNLFCQIDEVNPGPGLLSYNTSHFPTLTVATDPDPPCCNGDTLVLQGNFDAEIDGIISTVSTLHCFTYPANATPSTCNNSSEFTLTSITPINITAGQQVLVTVRISFS